MAEGFRFIGFNPTLVRFCREPSNCCNSTYWVSIPPWFDFAPQSAASTLAQRWFQSHLGSILPSATKAALSTCTLVSIPPWFDFALRATCKRHKPMVVSIPPWFDFAPQPHATAAHKPISFNPTLVRFCPVASTKSSCNPSFQSHLGSILPLQGAARAASRRGFNPTLVRFCQRRKEGNAQQSRWFQSHLGSILPVFVPVSQLCSTSSFNPTLVRFCPGNVVNVARTIFHVSIPPWFDFALTVSWTSLRVTSVSIPPWFDFALHNLRHASTVMRVSIPPWFDFARLQASRPLARRPFQSHLGSILPAACLRCASCTRQFQSHLGSILPSWGLFCTGCRGSFNPTLVRFCLSRTRTAPCARHGFNPTLVRFCPSPTSANSAVIISFQSHLGSILPHRLAGYGHVLDRFNPTLVRFCHGRRRRALHAPKVSIPPWFDFATREWLPKMVERAVSIPPWFDFAKDESCRSIAFQKFQSHLGSILP